MAAFVMKNIEKMLVRKVHSTCFSVILVMLSCGCCSAALLTRMLNLAEHSAGSLHRIFAKLFAAHVAGQHETFAAFGFDQPFRFPSIAVLGQINNRNIRTLLGEKDRNGTANSTITAGDERDFIS
jgi:hypothetical protein